MKRPISLVTGCAGFLGSHVADELLRSGHIVIGLDDLSGGFAENNPAGVEFYLGSITDTILVDGLFEQYPFDYIIHCAGHTAASFSHSIRPYHYDNILTGSMNLIHAAIISGTVKNFIFVSSSSVLGLSNRNEGQHSDRPPLTPYAIAKHAVEMDLRCAHQQWGLPYTIFRIHNIIGERQNFGADLGNPVAQMIHQASLGQVLTVSKNSDRIVSFAHISETAPVIAAAIRPAFHQQTFDLGGLHRRTEQEIAEMTAAALNIPLRINYVVASHPDIAPLQDTGLLTELLGHPVPYRSPDESIRSTVLWATVHGSRQNRLFEHIKTFARTPRGGGMVAPQQAAKAA